MIRRWTIVLAASLLPLFAVAAQAAEEAARLEPVVVTAGRLEEKAKNVTASMTVIGQEELARNQYQDMAQLLRNHGFQVNAYPVPGTMSQLTIRGMRSAAMGDADQGSVLLLVNGRRAGTDNISLVPLVNVERIEIIRGPAAVQYGTSAVGGVVNVITKRGTDLSAALETGFGSWDGYRMLAELSGSGYGFDASGGVSVIGQGADYDTGRGDDYGNTDLNYNFAYNVNLGYTFADEHRLGVNFQGVRADDSGSPGDSTFFTPGDRVDRLHQGVDFTYEGGASDYGLSWSGRYYIGEYQYEFDSPPNEYGDYYSNSKNDYRGAQGQLNWTYEMLTLSGGVDWVKDKRVYSSSTFADMDSSVENTGLFALAKLNLFDDQLTLSGGARYDRYDMEMAGRSNDESKVTPSVGVAWNPLDWLTLRANYGESFRVPHSIAVLGYYDGMDTYLGNPDLVPEKGKSWDFGGEIHHQSLTLGATYFQTRYKNKIIARDVGWDKQFYNLPGTSKLDGVELNASYDLGEAFDWPFMLRPYATLTHLLNYEDPSGNDLQYVAETEIAWGLNFNHPDVGLDIDLRFTYLGEQKVPDTAIWNDPPTVTIGGDIIADLFISQVITNFDHGGKLSLRGEVRNIFDTAYETIKYYEMPGRSFYAGLRYDF